MTFGGKVREGLWKRQHASCAVSVQGGGWQSGQMERGEPERHARTCTGNIGKEDDEAEKAYWSPVLKGRAKETGLPLFEDAQSVPRPATSGSPGSWLDMQILHSHPRPRFSRFNSAGCGLTNPLGVSNAHRSLRTTQIGVYSATYFQTGKFNSFPQTKGLK